jgi:ubiquinone/menaquinone biosynthesis C-methylase UbiE
VILTWDRAFAGSFWLTRDYVPELDAWTVAAVPSLGEISDELGPLERRAVPIPRDCEDGFLRAWWARPEAYLDEAVRRNISQFNLVDPEAVRRGVELLERDLADGVWDERHGRLRTLGELDLGYVLLVAQPRRDWRQWHEAYEDASPLRARLDIVQDRIRDALTARPADRPTRVISLCAGQGRDLLPVLAERPERNVSARLVELDAHNVSVARERVRDENLDGVDVVQADAALTSAYEGAVPADLILVCGVFGNVSDADVRTTIGELSRLCAPGATVIWTRSRRAPDLTPSIRSWFAHAGFEEISFVGEPGSFSVGVHRLRRGPDAFRADLELFRFRR